MVLLSQGEDHRDSLNLSGRKRVSGESDGRDLKGKKVRIFDGIDGNLGVFSGIDGEKKERIENKAMGFGGENQEMNLNGNGVFCFDGLYPCDAKRMDFDLNVGMIDLEDDEFVPVVVNGRVETIDISSDESEDEEVIEIVADDVKGKGKLIVEETGHEFVEDVNLFGLVLRDGNFDGNSNASDERRYTREEKEIAKVVDSWSSLALNPSDIELLQERQDLTRFSPLSVNGNQMEGSESRKELACRRDAEYDIERQIHKRNELRKNAHKFARWEEHGDASSSQEKPPLEDDALLRKSPGLFSTALKMVKERMSRRPEQLICWKPSNNGFNAPVVPSLLGLSMKVLAENAEAITSLEHVPGFLRRRLADSICSLRKMDINTFELFVKGSPTQICIMDCSWLTEYHFSKAFGNFDAKNLKVLQLELCGQCTLDCVISKTLARFPKSMPNLGILSLKGASRLTDDGLKEFLMSAPRLQSINLSHCSLLTNVGINILAESLGSMLKELYISDCQKLDALLILPALKKFSRLEVLSVAGIQTVSDQFVDVLVTTYGQNLKELDFASCLCLTDSSLKVIGETCSGLHSLNISNLDKLTDLALQFLADGCQHIRTLKLCRNNFSDEATAAFLEVAGESLKELSLNNVTSVGPCTAYSIAKCSRKLLGLDMSWCRKLTNEALGLIVDSCLSLKLVKLFGCTQITDRFLNGHSNAQVRIIGLQLTPILENSTLVEPSEVLLRYSALDSLSDTT